MKEISLKKRTLSQLDGSVKISSSKSESNRLLLINALSAKKAILENLSDARDTRTMKNLLESDQKTWDVKDAGTTMRFLTAFLALNGTGHLITGTPRMKERPIGPLVDALRQIGAQIEYEEKDGFPPLRIQKVNEQFIDAIEIPGNISSQYISALLMIAPCLPRGLSISLTTEIFSRPYIEMTLSLMKAFGVDHKWEDKTIEISSQPYQPSQPSIAVESDWSGASYWYSFVALNPGGGQLFLPYLRQKSTQGDSAIAKIMSQFGVHTSYEQGGVRISQTGQVNERIILDFKECPDLAQTVLVTAAAKGLRLEMTGLESLKIKETDRVFAMTKELEKIGAKLIENGTEWTLEPGDKLSEHVHIETYEDHRMAMAFAPLACLMNLTINEPNVVEKSYPTFWKEVGQFIDLS